jgi:hypothetical protein
MSKTPEGKDDLAASATATFDQAALNLPGLCLSRKDSSLRLRLERLAQDPAHWRLRWDEVGAGGRQSFNATTEPELLVLVAYRESAVTKLPPFTIAKA